MNKPVGFFHGFRSLSFTVFTLFTLILSGPLTSVASAANRPLALVYKGPGTCVKEDQCPEAAAAVAHRAGFDVKFIGPKFTATAIFHDAAVYIQPGGEATDVGEAMLPSLKKVIRAFVADGGGYVGFCAGAFFAMTPFKGFPRLGLIDGDADVSNHKYPSIVSVSWPDGKRHHVYWEGGAYFKLPKNTDFEVVSRYLDTKQPAGIRGPVGKGRAWVTGYHPEAPADWRHDPDLKDSDGVESDLDLAVEMIRWAARPQSFRRR